MRMGRVSAGRRRVALNRNSVLGFCFFIRKRRDDVWTHTGMVYYDHSVEFANVGIG